MSGPFGETAKQIDLVFSAKNRASVTFAADGFYQPPSFKSDTLVEVLKEEKETKDE
jgi:hypothetical protein